MCNTESSLGGLSKTSSNNEFDFAAWIDLIMVLVAIVKEQCHEDFAVLGQTSVPCDIHFASDHLF